MHQKVSGVSFDLLLPNLSVIHKHQIIREKTEVGSEVKRRYRNAFHMDRGHDQIGANRDQSRKEKPKKPGKDLEESSSREGAEDSARPDQEPLLRSPRHIPPLRRRTRSGFRAPQKP